MAKIMMSSKVLKSLGQLPQKVQKYLGEFIEKFQVDPWEKGLGVHPMKASMLDSKVHGADMPLAFRAILIRPDHGDTWLLVYIDKHDDAYNWAKNKRFEVHEKTGVFQIFDAQEVEEVVAEQKSFEPTSDYPLAKLTEEELFQAGVPRPLIPAVQAIHSDVSLEALTGYLPQDCRDVLCGIAAGMTLDQALLEMLAIQSQADKVPVVAGPGDFTHIESSPSFDLVLITGEEHLREILSKSLVEWRLFLHPCQKKLVEWRVKGPMKIFGAAGTGKTVALMHRAVFLVRKLVDPKARVLVTTYTTNLSITIRDHLKILAGNVADKIEVTNLHALARTICGRAGWRGRIADNDELDKIWTDLWLDQSLGELPMAKEEMRKEYETIIDGQGIDTEEDYLSAIRTGRPRITRDQRIDGWKVFIVFQRALKKRDLLTFEGAIHQARCAVEAGQFPRFQHVLVDEVQDFSLEALRLIRALSWENGAAPDSLCVVGDGHQRIYRKAFPLSRAGIQTQGRSRRLKVNYRTSDQIRRFAQAILNGLDVDNLDGEKVSISGDHSVFKGPEPTVLNCADPAEEGKKIVAWLEELHEKASVAWHEMCVTPYRSEIRGALEAAEIPTYELKPKEGDPQEKEPGVRMGSMKRIKGLEFRAIAMACGNSSDPMNDLMKAEIQHRCERYVASTRAREYLLVTKKGSE